MSYYSLLGIIFEYINLTWHQSWVIIWLGPIIGLKHEYFDWTRLVIALIGQNIVIRIGVKAKNEHRFVIGADTNYFRVESFWRIATPGRCYLPKFECNAQQRIVPHFSILTFQVTSLKPLWWKSSVYGGRRYVFTFKNLLLQVHFELLRLQKKIYQAAVASEVSLQCLL